MYIKGEINVERMKSVQGATATNASLRQINNDHVKFENAFSYNIQHICMYSFHIMFWEKKYQQSTQFSFTTDYIFDTK